MEEGNDLCCLPIDEQYFEYIFTKALSWGMNIYEQGQILILYLRSDVVDWLGTVAMSMNVTIETVDKAHQWLSAMNTAALKLGVNVMYDSPISCEILQSAEFQSAQQGSGTLCSLCDSPASDDGL